MDKKIKITKNMNLAEIIEHCPKAAEILLEYGLHCIGCAAASFENLEEAMKVHGLSKKEMDEIMEKINKSL